MIITKQEVIHSSGQLKAPETLGGVAKPNEHTLQFSMMHTCVSVCMCYHGDSERTGLCGWCNTYFLTSMFDFITLVFLSVNFRFEKLWSIRNKRFSWNIQPQTFNLKCHRKCCLYDQHDAAQVNDERDFKQSREQRGGSEGQTPAWQEAVSHSLLYCTLLRGLILVMELLLWPIQWHHSQSDDITLSAWLTSLGPPAE